MKYVTVENQKYDDPKIKYWPEKLIEIIRSLMIFFFNFMLVITILILLFMWFVSLFENPA